MAESSSRIARVEAKVDEIAKDLHRIDTVLNNGLRDTVRRIEETLNDHISAQQNYNTTQTGKKKPRRLEILTGVMALLLGLQTLGIFEGVRQAIAKWLAG